jgi:hypothetical protein
MKFSGMIIWTWVFCIGLSVAVSPLIGLVVVVAYLAGASTILAYIKDYPEEALRLFEQEKHRHDMGMLRISDLRNALIRVQHNLDSPDTISCIITEAFEVDNTAERVHKYG